MAPQTLESGSDKSEMTTLANVGRARVSKAQRPPKSGKTARVSEGLRTPPSEAETASTVTRGKRPTKRPRRTPSARMLISSTQVTETEIKTTAAASSQTSTRVLRSSITSTSSTHVVDATLETPKTPKVPGNRKRPTKKPKSTAKIIQKTSRARAAHAVVQPPEITVTPSLTPGSRRSSTRTPKSPRSPGHPVKAPVDNPNAPNHHQKYPPAIAVWSHTSGRRYNTKIAKWGADKVSSMFT